jgi:S1-C subfamily serine protease
MTNNLSFLCSQDTNTTISKTDQDHPAIWEFKNYDEFSKSTVRIVGTYNLDGVVGGGHGSGVIISINKDRKHPSIEGMCLGHIITCNHVTPENSTLKIVVEYQNGESSIASVLIRDQQRDLALLKAWVPSELKVVQPATEKSNYGDIVRVCGYGLITDVRIPRYFECKILRSSSLVVVLLEDALPGDSGGPIFNKDGKLVGLVSSGVTAFQFLNNTKYTGPSTGPTTIAIKNLLSLYAIKLLAQKQSEVFN